MKRDAIVILGGGLIKDKNGQWHSTRFKGPVFASHLRVFAGYYLFKKNPASLMIAIGGKGYLKSIAGAPTVSQIIKNELVAMGVPPKSILEEKKPNNTYQSLQKIKNIMLSQKINKIDMVTNQFHLGRIRAFISQDAVMKKLLKYNKIRMVAAEPIVKIYKPELKNKIKMLYQSDKMKAVIALERTGIRQIKNGKYDLHSNTSLSNAYK